jgi:hypothetical protein
MYFPSIPYFAVRDRRIGSGINRIRIPTAGKKAAASLPRGRIGAENFLHRPVGQADVNPPG